MRYKILICITLLFAGTGCTRLFDSADEKNGDWNTYRSEHYIFYVRDNSEAERAIEKIQQEQERAYREINERLDISFTRMLKVYIYDSRQDMGETDRTGIAHPEIGTIEVIYNSEIQSIGVPGVSLHELSHLVVFYEWCPVSEPVFAEGLAVWLDDYWGDPAISTTNLFSISKKRMEAGTLPAVEAMVTGWSGIESRYSYPAAGSFTKYLVQEYGLNAFRQLYCEAQRQDFDSVFFEIYGKQFWEVETEYETFLQNY
ncbi:hypothetical protein ACG2F4_16720 [Halalkalibaculum sp. DA3122]|uniref:hypothetical protein n=1 Tax=unclassified Halalkalibaculum TaxID=2964617 RepID=UPI003754670E